jgi:hypothetical protein
LFTTHTIIVPTVVGWPSVVGGGIIAVLLVVGHATHDGMDGALGEPLTHGCYHPKIHLKLFLDISKIAHSLD